VRSLGSRFLGHEKVSQKEFLKKMGELAKLIRDTTVKPFDGETPADKQERIARALRDKLFFAKTYFPHYCTSPFSLLHGPMQDADDVADIPVVVTGPRGFAKSVHISLISKIHKIVFKRRHFIGIGSRSVINAAEYTGAIKEELENNQRLIADFGELLGTKRNSHEDFRTTTGIRVLAFGVKDSIKGMRNGPYRFDDITLEDLEDRFNIVNARVRKKLLRKILSDVKYAMSPTGWTFIFVGNYFSKKTIAHSLLRDEQFKHWRRVEFDSIVEKNGKWVASNWPEQWPLALLKKLRDEDGSDVFDAEMRGKPRDEDDLFPEEWFRRAAHENAHVKRYVFSKVAGVDLSAKSKDTSDYKAIVIVGAMKGPRYPVLDAYIRRTTKWKLLRQCFELEKKWHVNLWIFQVVGFEDTIREDIVMLEEEYGFTLNKRYLPVTENKDLRITSVQSDIENARMTFDKSVGDQQLLIDQYVDYQPGGAGGHDDGPDAAETAVSGIKRLVKGAIVKVRTIEA
jgi:predicted phage terminase large subunit-like protein